MVNFKIRDVPITAVGERMKASAMTWIGTPYLNYARVKGKGVDCGNLLLACLVESGAVAEGSIEIEQYSNEWHLHRSEEKFTKYLEPITDEVDTIEVGDILLFQYGRCISHGAIYVGGGMVVHAYVDRGTVLSELDDIIFYDNSGKHRLRKVFRARS